MSEYGQLSHRTYTSNTGKAEESKMIPFKQVILISTSSSQYAALQHMKAKKQGQGNLKSSSQCIKDRSVQERQLQSLMEWEKWPTNIPTFLRVQNCLWATVSMRKIYPVTLNRIERFFHWLSTQNNRFFPFTLTPDQSEDFIKQSIKFRLTHLS